MIAMEFNELRLKNGGKYKAAALFLHKILQTMEMKRRNKGMYWILFLLSVAALFVAIFTHWPWLTLILPFMTTFFVLAMDII